MEKFECLHCGRCCEKIITTEYGVSVGMYLKPSEIRLFRRYPSAVKPYFGIAKRDNSKPKKIICYQLAIEPCPLYDEDTKSCKQYDSRPIACRAYPFGLRDGGRVMIEEHCKWGEGTDFKKGDKINAAEPVRYAHELSMDFMKYASERPDLPVLLFDVRKKKWVKLKLEK